MPSCATPANWTRWWNARLAPSPSAARAPWPRRRRCCATGKRRRSKPAWTAASTPSVPLSPPTNPVNTWRRSWPASTSGTANEAGASKRSAGRRAGHRHDLGRHGALRHADPGRHGRGHHQGGRARRRRLSRLGARRLARHGRGLPEPEP
ncbi:hypothetical protein G6F24_016618 [Rhizopus arrhizus]|nr:hypothetical protein G6F24_016618 [Rhizopus arrhizus]